MKGIALCQGLAAISPILKQQKEYKYLTTVDQLSKLYFFHWTEYFPFFKKLYFNPPPPLPWWGAAVGCTQWLDCKQQRKGKIETQQQKYQQHLLQWVECVVCMRSRAWSCPTLCDLMNSLAHQAPLSMESSRQEYWSGLPFPPPGDLLNPRVKPMSPALVSGFFTKEPSGKPVG